MTGNSLDNIDPQIARAGIALALWAEDNLFCYVAPGLIENEGPAVRICAMRPAPQKGWTEFFPARRLPDTSCGVSIRFRALGKGERLRPGLSGVEMNGVVFAAEIYATFEERFAIIRITDPEHRLIAKPLTDEDDMEMVAESDAGDDILLRGAAILDMAGLPLTGTPD